MNRNTLTIVLCFGIATLMILSTLPAVPMEKNVSDEVEKAKEYSGPKEVYKDGDVKKGKPSGPPGQGNKPPKDDGPQPDPSVDKWAVVIGISDYRGKQNDLQYCDDDAMDMYNYLISKGYPEGNIKLLTDGAAKAKAIMSAIDWLNSWEGANSEVVFFYSGHGTTYEGYDDGDDEYTDEAIVSADLYLILDGQLKQKFSTFDSQKISFTFDSCYSGGMNDLSDTGRVVVAACDENEFSYDGTPSQQNGVFTYYYVDGLTTYDTVEDAFNYAKPLAHNFVLENYGKNMNPQIYDLYTGSWSF